MKNVQINGWVFENYNALTGNVIDQEEGRLMADNYYTWGGLLGLISLIEHGYVTNPLTPLR